MAKVKAKPQGEGFWLTRDTNPTAPCYCLYEEEPAPADRDGDGNWFDADGVLRDDLWESVAPSSLHLKPGGGPIKVQLTRAAVR